MMRFNRLLKNEKIKLFKKKSTIIFIILIILSSFACVGLTFAIKYSYSNYSYNAMSEENLKSQIEYLKTVNDNNSKASIEMYEYVLNNNINIEKSYYWKTQAVYSLISLKAELYDLQDLTPDEPIYISMATTDNYVTKLESQIDEMFNALKTDDYYKYIDIQISSYEEQYKDKEITEEEKNINIEILNITKKYEVGKENDTKDESRSSLLTEIMNLKLNLANGVDDDNIPLTEEKKDEINNTILVDMYKLENNIEVTPAYSNETNYKQLFLNLSEGLSGGLISLFMIIVAGGIMSQEFSKGTIKLLTINPVKRWKILLSKILICIIISIILSLLMAGITVGLGEIFFSDYTVAPYVYVNNGVATSISVIPYTILRFLANDISIIVYTILALMLSVITRNTAASVGIGIFVYIGASTAVEIINAYITSEWIKFLPFNNLDFTSKIFKDTSSLTSSTISYNSVISSITLDFSICVIAVCLVLMLVTMFESFNKRDIN